MQVRLKTFMQVQKTFMQVQKTFMQVQKFNMFDILKKVAEF